MASEIAEKINQGLKEADRVVENYTKAVQKKMAEENKIGKPSQGPPKKISRHSYTVMVFYLIKSHDVLAYQQADEPGRFN